MSAAKNPKKHPEALIAPAVKFPPRHFEQFMGMNPRQSNLAFQAALKQGEASGRRMCKAHDQMRRAERELEAAITAARRELVMAMYRKYPAAARRIVAGMKRVEP
jgi:hypothetical protein